MEVIPIRSPRLHPLGAHPPSSCYDPSTPGRDQSTRPQNLKGASLKRGLKIKSLKILIDMVDFSRNHWKSQGGHSSRLAIKKNHSTLPEQQKHLKNMDGWKTIFLLRCHVFRCLLLVSGRVADFQSHWTVEVTCRVSLFIFGGKSFSGDLSLEEFSAVSRLNLRNARGWHRLGTSLP